MLCDSLASAFTTGGGMGGGMKPWVAITLFRSPSSLDKNYDFSMSFACSFRLTWGGEISIISIKRLHLKVTNKKDHLLKIIL
jgi:hypothetical protein